MDEEKAQRLSKIYDAMIEIFIDNPDVVMEELYRDPSVMKYYSLGSLQRLYDNANPEQQQ